MAFADPTHVVFVSGCALKLVDIATGAERILPSAGASVDIFAVSQESSTCVYSERVAAPRLFVVDLQNASVICTIQKGPDVVKYADLALSSDGLHLAAIEDSPTFTLTVWDLSAGAPLVVAEASVTPLMNYRLSFSPATWATLFSSAGAHVAVWSVEQCRGNHFLTSKTYTLPFVNPPRRRSSLVTDDVEDDLSLPALNTVVPPPSATCHGWVHPETVLVGCRLGEIFSLDCDSGIISIVHDGRDGPGSSDAMAVVGGALTTTVIVGGVGNRLKFLTGSNYHVARAIEGVPCAAVAATASGQGEEMDVVVGGQGQLARLYGDGVVPIVMAHPTVPTAVGCFPGFVVTLAADGLRVSHSTFGSLISFYPHTSATCIAFHPAQPLIAVGSSTGAVDLLHLNSEGTLVLASRSSLHPGSLCALSFDNTGLRLVSLGGSFLAVTAVAPGLPLLGHTTAPARVDALAVGAGSDNVTVVVVAHGEKGKASHVSVLSIPEELTSAHRDESLAMHADVLQRRSFRVAAELGSMCVVPAGVVAMGRTHMSLLRFPLSAGNNELVKPTPIPAHSVRGVGQVITLGNGVVVVSVGGDGALCLVDCDKGVDKLTLPIHLAAASAVCGSHDGTRLFTVGPDGLVSCVTFSGNSPAAKSIINRVSSHITKLISHTAAILPPLTSGRASEGEEGKGQGQQQQQQQSALVSALAVAEKAAGSPAQAALVAKVQALRKQVHSLIETNGAKPALEQLARDELAVDVARRDALMAAKDQAVRGLKEDINYLILAQQFLRHVVKMECWDGMETVGRTIYAFGEGLEVANYPLARPDARHEMDLRRVLLLRRIETAEHRSRHGPRSPVPLLSSANAFVFSTQPGPPEQKSSTSEALSLVSHPVEAPTPTTNGPSFHNDEEEEEEGGAFNPLSLITSQRKRDQVVLLKQQVRVMKASFNKQFDDVCRAKEDERAKITERNQRIQEIMDELKIAEALFVPPPFLLENPHLLLEVKDSEVKVRKVLTQAEQAAVDVAKAKEIERMENESKDNPRIRGLNDMMDGRLEQRDGEDLWIDLVPPPFMTNLAAEDWGEEEKRVAGEFEKKRKELAEERDKRKKALDAELRKLQEAIKTGCDAFDARVQELFQAKIATEQAVTCEELRMLKLAKALEDERDAVAMETELEASIDALSQTQARLAPALAHARKAVAECQAEYEALVQADKMQEKAFKMRREFGDHSPHADVMFKLFKKRPKRHPAAAGEVVVPPLDKAADCPEGVDDGAWAKLVELRQQKIDSEAAVRTKMGELAELTAFLNRRAAEDDDVTSTIGELQETIRARAEERMRGMLDLELLVVLKQGQVEVQHSNDFDPNYSSAILIHRAAIEDLNANLRKLAEAKVDHLKQRMELRKGIHRLEWEHKRLDLEISDVTERSREIQLMRVTKDLVASGGGSEEERHRKEVETLTKTIAVSETAFAQTAEEKRKSASKLKKKTRKILEENEVLSTRLADLERTVSDRSAIHRVQQAIVGDGGRQQRMKELASQRKMQNLTATQAEDLGALREEVERLRMRTFPAFGRADPRIV